MGCNESDEEFNHSSDYLKHRKRTQIESLPIWIWTYLPDCNSGAFVLKLEVIFFTILEENVFGWLVIGA